MLALLGLFTWLSGLNVYAADNYLGIYNKSDKPIKCKVTIPIDLSGSSSDIFDCRINFNLPTPYGSSLQKGSQDITIPAKTTLQIAFFGRLKSSSSSSRIVPSYVKACYEMWGYLGRFYPISLELYNEDGSALSSDVRVNLTGNLYALYFNLNASSGYLDLNNTMEEIRSSSSSSNAFFNFRGLFKNWTAIEEVADDFLSSNGVRGDSIYMELFYGCSNLTKAPKLTYSCLGSGIFYCRSMFENCKSLTTVSDIESFSVNKGAWEFMFKNCTSLKQVGTLNCRSVGDHGCNEMFRNCTSLTQVGNLTALSVSDYGYMNMFRDCKALKNAPEISATSLGERQPFSYMFYGCTSLEKGPSKLPATDLRVQPYFAGCYQYMFCGCTNLTSAPDLPAETVGLSSYFCMFKDCKSLKNPPSISAKHAKYNSSFESMFEGCTSLQTTPNLNITTIGNDNLDGAARIFCRMFAGCTSLTDIYLPSALDAVRYSTGGWPGCYYTSICKSMYEGCTSLVDLSRHTLQIFDDFYKVPSGTYERMFANCTSLVISPKFVIYDDAKLEDCTYSSSSSSHPASFIYLEIFDGCTSLKDILVEWTAWPRLIHDGGYYSLGDPTVEWVKGVPPGGVFRCPCALSEEYSNDRIPYGWKYECHKIDRNRYPYQDLVVTPPGLTFKPAGTTSSSVALKWSGSSTAPVAIEYAAGSSAFTDYTLGTVVTVAAGDSVVFRAKSKDISFSTSPSSYYYFTTSGGDVNVSGNVMYLLDPDGKERNLTSIYTSTDVYTFYHLFEGCSIVNVVDTLLPATTLSEFCYEGMFLNCSKLTTPPSLPSTNVSQFAYASMFKNCKALTSAPELKSTTVQRSSYKEMFSGCTSLTHDGVKDLYARLSLVTIVDQQAFQSMFEGCTKLTSSPNLLSLKSPVADCCRSMFKGCTALKEVGSLVPTRVGTSCYESMFENCTAIEKLEDNVFPPTDNIIVTCTNDRQFARMFYGCSSLTMAMSNLNLVWESTAGVAALSCSADEMSSVCESMFENCVKLEKTPKLTATKVGPSAYRNMFKGCTSLLIPSALPATTLSDSCYMGMFDGCTKLNSVPELLASTMKPYCYAYMFRNCSSLTNGPKQMKGTKFADYSCYYMFAGCTKLNGDIVSTKRVVYGESIIEHRESIDAEHPEPWYETIQVALRDTLVNIYDTNHVMAPYCLSHAFDGCTSLTEVPVFINTRMDAHSCEAMFNNCTGINRACTYSSSFLDGVDVRTNNAAYCFKDMFNGCTNLGSGKDTITLFVDFTRKGMFEAMFKGCTALENIVIQNDPNAIEVSAATDAPDAWKEMLRGCSSMKYIQVSIKSWGSGGYLFTQDWVNGLPVTGIFNCPDELHKEWTVHRIPDHWTTNLPPGLDYGLHITAKGDNVTVKLNWTGNPTSLDFVYYTDEGGLVETSIGGSGAKKELEFPLKKNRTVYMAKRGAAGTSFSGETSYYYFTIEGGKVDVGGYITSLVLGYNATEPRIVASSIDDYCFYKLFANCTNIETLSTVLSVESVGKHGLDSMFAGCTGMDIDTNFYSFYTDAVDDYGLANMFKGCTKLTRGQGFMFSTLGEGALSSMYEGCTAMTKSNFLYFPASIGKGACKKMYSGCTKVNFEDGISVNMTSAPESAFEAMFLDCSTLNCNISIIIPTIGKQACKDMFNGCANLITPAYLSATTIGENGMNAMFKDCKKLSGVGGFTSANNIGKSALYEMFRGCEALNFTVEDLTLPATKLSDDCYQMMFYGCKALTYAPDLPARTMKSTCYRSMFNGCTSLVKGPHIQADTLVSKCCETMFNSCSSLMELHVDFASWSTTTPFNGWVGNVNTTNGTFYCPRDLALKYGVNNIPTGWKVIITDDRIDPQGFFLSLTANNAPCTLSLAKGTTTPNTDLYYFQSWNKEKAINTGATITVPQGGTLYFVSQTDRGTTSMDGYNFTMTTTGTGFVTASGNILSLLYTDRKTTSGNDALQSETLPASSFKGLFKNCTILTSSPTLPSVKMSKECYSEMFSGCSRLTTPPRLEHVTTLAESCYASMFKGCTSLVSTSGYLPYDMDRQKACFKSMFEGCTSLLNMPQFTNGQPDQNLAESCYESMFNGCTSLQSDINLRVNTLAKNCYANMFKGCTKIATAIVMGNTLAEGCFKGMFEGCSALSYFYTDFVWKTDESEQKKYSENWLKDAKNGSDCTFGGPCPPLRSVTYIPDQWIIPRCNPDEDIPIDCNDCN